MLKSFKHALRVKLEHYLGVPTVPHALERLKNIGFSPKHVFDVGASRGEFASLCLDLWPHAQVTCFEVLPEPSIAILNLEKKHRNLRLISCLLGASCRDKVEFNLADSASSVLTETAHPLPNKALYPMSTVDEVVLSKCSGKPPDFLKMDVQGYELEVLKGALKSLRSMSLVLAEVNLLDLHNGVPLLADLVGWMSNRGWVTYDICGMWRRPLDQALWQADFIFVPESSALRADKRYSVQ